MNSLLRLNKFHKQQIKKNNNIEDMAMSLEEYKKQLEKVAKESGVPRLMNTFEKTPDKDWQVCLEMNLTPSTALYSIDQGLI